MFDSWYLKRSPVQCQNDYDCGYMGRLDEFAEVNDEDYSTDEEIVLYGECPRCGKSIKITASPHIDFYITEESYDR